MHFSFLTFFLFVAFAHAESKSCARFWPGIKPGEHFTVDATCHLFPGYPKIFGKTKVTVAYTKNWGNSGVKTDQVAPVLNESLTKSIETYGRLTHLSDEIVVILSVEVNGTTWADTIHPIQRHPPCQVKLYKRWTTDAIGKEVPRALQTLAHELYHCVQGLSKLGNSQEPSWVIEGSANYFSNRVFDSSNIEWPGPGREYNPALPIYAQVGRATYTASLYFQSLEKPRGPEYLNTWVLSTPPSSPKEESARLSRLSGFTDDFFIFAKQLSLGSIEDTSGVPIQHLPKINPVSASVSFDKAGTTGTASLKTVPFSVTVFKLSLKPGQTAAIYSSADDGQRLAYRKTDDKAWKEMPSDSSSGGGQINLPCNDKGTAETFLVLFVSTADINHDTVKITIKRHHLENCKTAGGFVLFPLFDGATHGARCPSGTHFASTAAWCCPDGMELDQTVSSELAICCPTSADCSKGIVPDNLRCADPKWELWSQHFRQIGCCLKGYVPTSSRFCVKDTSELGPGFSEIPQG